MDAEFLSGMIRELMLSHDSLNLPGLGSFVVEEVPASFSDKGYTINPPYRRLGFVERSSDDSFLTDLYSGANPQAPKEAEEVLLDFIGQVKEELVQRKVVELPGLGRLRATRENHFFFVADEALDISPEACGLMPVSLKTHKPAILPSIDSLPASCIPPDRADVATGSQEEPSAPAAPGDAAPKRQRKRLPLPLRMALGVVGAACILLAAFVAVSRLAPGFTDKLLYTQEELYILNYPEDGLGLPG